MCGSLCLWARASASLGLLPHLGFSVVGQASVGG